MREIAACYEVFVLETSRARNVRRFEDKLDWDFRTKRRGTVWDGMTQCAGYRCVKQDLVNRMSVRISSERGPMSSNKFIHTYTYITGVGRDSSVGIATRYGLDGPGIESRWGRDFSHTSRPALGPTQPPIQWVPGLSRG